VTPTTDVPYPGERLGLPPSGVGSVATTGPRVLGFAVDTVAANLIAFATTGGQGPNGVYVLAAFALQMWLGTAFVAGSIGHHVAGLAVMRVDREPAGLWRAFIRTLLACLLIPAAIWDRDQRGLHDMAAQTVLVRRR
jgi:uncharacterized RDD family membrane protein YckC